MQGPQIFGVLFTYTLTVCAEAERLGFKSERAPVDNNDAFVIWGRRPQVSAISCTREGLQNYVRETGRMKCEGTLVHD